VVPHFIWERRQQERLKSEPQFRVPGGRKPQESFFGQILRAGIYFRQGAPLLAIRMKCCRETGRLVSAANCAQSAAKRMHFNECSCA
jgi:hypothetical protein